MPDETTSALTGDAGQISRVALKMPQFWEKEADLWFINVEAQFVLADITRDETKYYAVVSALNSEVLSHVSDIVKNPPKDKLYESLKERLIAEFGDSEQKRVKDLLSNAVLGDDKPSHLLRRMRQLANNAVGDEFLKTLWIQRLPITIQGILSISEGNFDQLARMADKMLDITPQHHQVAETNFRPTNDQSAIGQLQAQIAALTEQVSRLASDRQPHRRHFSRNRSSSRGRPRTPERSQDLCWYHSTFKDKAKKCKPPCKHQEN